MAIAYPNRTGEVGTYNSGDTITLPGAAALPGLRTFATAASAGKLSADDYLGLHIKRSGNDSLWLVAIAQYSSGTLTIIETEDSAGTLSDGDQVDVTAVLTAKMLDSASLSYAPPTQTGPDWWDISSTTATTWNATDECYEHDAGLAYHIQLDAVTTGTHANWGTGLNPTSVSAELWIPAGLASYEYEFIQLKVYDSVSRTTDARGGVLGGSFTLGAWNTFTISAADLSSLTTVAALDIYSIDSMATFKLRNIVVQ